MSASRENVDVKKWKAARRAQFNLEKTFARIDFEEELQGEIDKLRKGSARAEIESPKKIIETPEL